MTSVHEEMHYENTAGSVAGDYYQMMVGCRFRTDRADSYDDISAPCKFTGKVYWRKLTATGRRDCQNLGE